jgi:hypothetical protein
MPVLGTGIRERHGKTIVDSRDIGERSDAVLRTAMTTMDAVPR